MSAKHASGRDGGQPASRRVPLETGLSYHVLEWDAPSSPRPHTVMLVHGFLDNAWSFEATVAAGLSDHFHVVAPDMRGHGDSDRVGAGGYYHFMDYVADLHSLVRALGRDRVSIVGHSMGGTVAGYFAGSFPEDVHRLALLEGLGPPEPATPMPERIRRWISGWQRALEPTTYPSIEDAAARLRARDPLLDEETSLRAARRATEETGHGRYRFKHDPLHTTTGPYPFQVDLAEPIWRAVRCPTLLVRGDASEPILSAADYARRAACFHHAREAVLPGAGHMMHRHRPRELSALLEPFLTGAEGARASGSP